MENFIFCAVAVAVPYFNIRHDFKTLFFPFTFIEWKEARNRYPELFTQKILSFMRPVANGILPG